MIAIIWEYTIHILFWNGPFVYSTKTLCLLSVFKLMKSVNENLSALIKMSLRCNRVAQLVERATHMQTPCRWSRVWVWSLVSGCISLPCKPNLSTKRSEPFLPPWLFFFFFFFFTVFISFVSLHLHFVLNKMAGTCSSQSFSFFKPSATWNMFLAAY